MSLFPISDFASCIKIPKWQVTAFRQFASNLVTQLMEQRAGGTCLSAPCLLEFFNVFSVTVAYFGKIFRFRKVPLKVPSTALQGLQELHAAWPTYSDLLLQTSRHSNAPFRCSCLHCWNLRLFSCDVLTTMFAWGFALNLSARLGIGDNFSMNSTQEDCGQMKQPKSLESWWVQAGR